MKNEGKDVLLARARTAGVNTQVVGDEWLRVMDRASSGRPHNGFILEASPLPRPPITQLGIASRDAESFLVQLDRQSREDAIVNGTREKYSYKSAGWRYPFLLYVDGVLDEGNLGAIARSAYFLGVDAIATPTRQIAPWSHIALKASAGAAEDIPIFTVAQPSTFLQHSALHGWRTYASDAIPGVEPPPMIASASSAIKSPERSTNIIFTIARSTKRIADHYPVASHPTILMIGGEGSGLRGSLLNQAHYKVGIPAGRDGRLIGLDSLNVSVAASMLCYEFMKKPPPKERKPGELLF
ncbi:Alpha/beta knot methyltransferase [Clohesyomyces aquaticus]|uniref:Alpha/beta knot methyltransferase n=1 Tax=Clohesyomyces aquaticus TaxID=1231657 RepID=A0A1Y1ZWR2_9PLEO|nr:Alpha/beta knot methyltransferase [Clohesyomyces aquaticus]